MTKKIFLLFTAAFCLQSCINKVVVNREVQTSDSLNTKMLLGSQSLSQFKKQPYAVWFNEEYDSYPVDLAVVKALQKKKFNSYKIIAFVGTWCEDTHREFPRLVKVLETEKYPMGKLEIIAVNKKMESPYGEDVKYNVKKAPTFIIQKYNTERGRIIEMTESGYIEKDLLQLIKNDREKK